MKNSLLNNFITYGVGNILFTLVNLILVPIFLEKIDVNEYGILSVFLVTVNLIMVFFSINISNGILRAFNEGFSIDREKIWLSTITLFFFFISLIIITTSLIFKEYLSKIVFNDITYNGLILLTFVVGFTRVFHGLFIGVLRARNKSIKYVILNLFNVISLACINIFIIYYTNFTLNSIIWGYVINGILTNVLGLILTINDYKLGFDFKGLSYLLKYGAPLGVANVISYFINYGNRYFLINYTNESSVALIDVSQKISSLVGVLFTGAFITAFTPYYLELYNKVDFKEFSKKINQIITSFIAIYLFLGLIVVLFQDFGLSLLSKKEYLDAAKYVPYITLSNLFYVLFMILTLGTNINKETKFEMYVTLIIFFISIFLNAILIKNFGIIGAIIVQVILNLISVFLIQYYNKRYFPISFNFFKLFKIISLFMLISYSYFFISSYFDDNNNLILKVFLSIILTLIFLGFYIKEFYSLKLFVLSFIKRK